jgi:hypothetical protein
LPEPVGPVTRTRPRGSSQSFFVMGGRPEAVDVGDLDRDAAQHGAELAALADEARAVARTPATLKATRGRR